MEEEEETGVDSSKDYSSCAEIGEGYGLGSFSFSSDFSVSLSSCL